MTSQTTEYSCKRVTICDQPEYGIILDLRKIFLEDYGDNPDDLLADDDQCDLYLMYSETDAIATARIKKCDAAVYEIESVMVAKPHRGKGVGSILLQYLLRQIAGMPSSAGSGNVTVFFDSLTHAVEFYRKCGFEAEGSLFFLAGVEHQKMVLRDPKRLLKVKPLA